MGAMNETPKFLVYGLIDPRTNELRYVGKSSSGMRRPKVHQTAGGRSRATAHNGRWLRALFNDGGVTPSILVLEVCGTYEETNLAEIRLISFFRAAGLELTNSTAGGDGASYGNQLRKGMVDSPEVRAKKSRARMGNQCRKGIPHTPEMKKHLSEVGKGRVLSSEAREKISASKRGVKRPEWVLQKMRLRKMSPETKAKLAAALAGRVPSAEERRKISAANKGKKRSPETRARMSASAKGRAVTPEARAKLSVSMKAVWALRKERQNALLTSTQEVCIVPAVQETRKESEYERVEKQAD